jgi:hypothetical protein
VNGPVFRDRPSTYGNVKLFPIGVDYSYTLFANVDETPVEGVTFRCLINTSQGNNFDVVGTNEDNDADNAFESTPLGVGYIDLSEASSFLAPHGDFETILEAVTDEDGLAVFDGDLLIKGAEYHCYGDWMEEVDGVLLSRTGFDGFTVGISRTFRNVEMNDESGALTAANSFYVLWANYNDTMTDFPGISGPIRFLFNRALQIVPATVDCQLGGLTVGWEGDDGVTTELVGDTVPADIVDDADDSAAENIDVDVVDDVWLEIAPIFDADGISTDDRDVTFTWDGIFFQPVSGLWAGDIFEFSGNGAGTGHALETLGAAATCGGVTTTNVGDRTDLADLTSAQMVGPQN